MSIDQNFVVPEMRKTSEVSFHHDVAPGLRFLAMDGSRYENAGIYIAVRRVNCISDSQPEYIDFHVHDVDSLYLFVGNEADLRGLRAVVRIGTTEREIESPMTVYIPKHARHSYKLTGGSGTYMSILLAGDYNAHTFPDSAQSSVADRQG